MENKWLSGSDKDRNVVIVAAAIAAFMVVIGSTLAWVTISSPFGQFSLAGTSGDGKITLSLGLVALLALGLLFLNATRGHIKPISVLILILGIVIVAIAVSKFFNFENLIADEPELAAFASIGTGLYLVLIGGIVLTACAGFSAYKCFQQEGAIETFVRPTTEDLPSLGTPRKILTRMLGAARLNAATFKDVGSHNDATFQAMVVVILVSIAGGVGKYLDGDSTIVNALVFGVIAGIASWAVWALVVWMIGSTILRTSTTQADWGQLARGIGFAQVPGLLNILVFVPGGGIISFVAFVWRVAAILVAVRQCLDYTSTLRAFLVVVIASIPVLIVNIVVALILGIGQ